MENFYLQLHNSLRLCLLDSIFYEFVAPVTSPTIMVSNTVVDPL